MKPAHRPPKIAEKLASAAASYQATAVIPHCPTCRAPCCKLDKLVIDLSWKQVKTLWQINTARQEFDQSLANGQGPEEIRSANGRYYIHSKPCPAYDTGLPGCRIYGQALKPPGCSDFPVYEDENVIVADLRCESVNLDQLSDHLARAIGPDYRVTRSANPEFPFLVEFLVTPARPGRARRQRQCSTADVV